MSSKAAHTVVNTSRMEFPITNERVHYTHSRTNESALLYLHMYIHMYVHSKWEDKGSIESGHIPQMMSVLSRGMSCSMCKPTKFLLLIPSTCILGFWLIAKQCIHFNCIIYKIQFESNELNIIYLQIQKYCCTIHYYSGAHFFEIFCTSNEDARIYFSFI